MKMSLKEIKTLLNANNTIFSQMPTSEGQVTDVVFQKYFQGLHIPVLTKAVWIGPTNISCGKKELFVVQTGDTSYDIHYSKTAHVRFSKQK